MSSAANRTYTEIQGGTIVHLNFATQKQLALTMSRPQEFYESNLDQFRGQVFTWAEFVEQFTTDDGEFRRLQDWSGYNIPGDVLDQFFELFDLSQCETELAHSVSQLRGHSYYVIGTSDSTPGVIDHELVHAHYYLNRQYRDQANTLVDQMDPVVFGDLAQLLSEWGYDHSVIVDEVNAYMSTTPQEYVKDKMKIQIPQRHMEPFIELASTVLDTKQHTVTQLDFTSTG